MSVKIYMLILLLQSSFSNVEDMCIFDYVFCIDLFPVYVGTVQYYCCKDREVIFRQESNINIES